MVDPPHELDGANVLFVSRAGTYDDFGTALDLESQNEVFITALAICQYEDSATYLFACDTNWNVIGDLCFDSVKEAMGRAEDFYEVKPIEWNKVS